MRIGIATDHGGFVLKEQLVVRLKEAGHEVSDFGAHRLNPGDDYSDFVIPLAQVARACDGACRNRTGVHFRMGTIRRSNWPYHRSDDVWSIRAAQGTAAQIRFRAGPPGVGGQGTRGNPAGVAGAHVTTEEARRCY